VRLAWLGIASMAVDLGAVYVKAPAAPRGVTWGDLIEVAGMYLVLALYASIAASLAVSLARSRPDPRPSRAPALSFLLLFVAFASYALGRGMHVASNAIHDLMGASGAEDVRALIYFWDERAGHLFVDAARILFVAGLCLLERGARTDASAAAREGAVRGGGAARLLALAGAAAYGFIYFASSVEGQTVFLALPFTAAVAIWGLRSRGRSPGRAPAPARAFFTAAALVSLLFFVIWGVWQRGFPEFTRAGIL
jgi:hypothetical protein